MALNEDEEAQKAKEEADEESLLLQAFCFATGAKQSNAHMAFMSLDQFKRGWLRLADLEKELKRRKLRFDNIAMSESRNRERLNRWITDQEKAYFVNMGKVC